MQMLVILSYTKPHHGGMITGSIQRTVTADPGTTRAGLLRWALGQLPDELKGAVVTFFYAEPNELGAEAGAGAAS